MNRVLTPFEISVFCTQIALMLNAAIALDVGISIMEKDSQDSNEKKMLQDMAEEIELGAPLSFAMEKIGRFPNYVISMAKIGEASGNLDEIMSSLSDYYKKEDRLRKTLKDALTYPLVMTTMMLAVLYVLMTRVMPIFQGVFAQLGTDISPLAEKAISMGGSFTTIALVVILIIVVSAIVLYLLSKRNIKISFIETCKMFILKKSSIALSVDIRRFCNVASIMISSGMDIANVIELSSQLAGNGNMKQKIRQCDDTMLESGSFLDGLKAMGVFSGFHQQMLTVGNRTGKLDTVLSEISDYYEEEFSRRIEGAIAKFEPTIIAILSIVVGLILLAVMLPLVGIMASMG